MILDDEGRYVDANPAACAMNGVPLADVLGKRIGAGSGALGSDEQFARMWRGLLRDGELAGELRLQRPDGSTCEIEFRATANYLPHRHLAILRDVTERKRSERRVAAQHAVTAILAEADTLRAAAPRVIEALCDCLDWCVGDLWIVDDRAAVMRCVEVWHQPGVQIPQFEAATRALVLPRGKGLPGRVWASRQPAWAADIQRDDNFPRAAAATADGLHAAFAFPILLGADVRGALEFFSPEVRATDDDVLNMLSAIGSQIGQFLQRKRAEASLVEADRRKDEFLAMLAHELRNPLAPMRNAMEIVSLAGHADEDIRRASAIVVRQLEHMTRLVDDLLDVARITRGTIALRKQRVDLQTVVARAVETCSPLLSSRRHRLEVTVPEGPLPVDADAARLEQVLANLLNNAAKYTDDGGIITLGITAEAGQIRIRVRDTGIGIAPELLPTIFDLFTQGDRSLERSQGGLGIGLTLVRTLVELHGGSVAAASGGIGQGSEFTVTLPAPPA